MKTSHCSLKTSQIVALIAYYLIAIHLPSSNNILLGNLWKWIRYICVKHIFCKCGKNVNVEHGARFGSGRNIRIGNNSGIGINADIPANTIIGDNVMMGPYCYIGSMNHVFDSTEEPMIVQGSTNPKQTVIGNDVWIGRNVMMTPGRNIAEGSIIGMGCVLTKDFPPYSIVGGNPSKVIRSRKS